MGKDEGARCHLQGAVQVHAGQLKGNQAPGFLGMV